MNVYRTSPIRFDRISSPGSNTNTSRHDSEGYLPIKYSCSTQVNTRISASIPYRTEPCNIRHVHHYTRYTPQSPPTCRGCVPSLLGAEQPSAPTRRPNSSRKSISKILCLSSVELAVYTYCMQYMCFTLYHGTLYYPVLPNGTDSRICGPFSLVLDYPSCSRVIPQSKSTGMALVL